MIMESKPDSEVRKRMLAQKEHVEVLFFVCADVGGAKSPDACSGYR